MHASCPATVSTCPPMNPSRPGPSNSSCVSKTTPALTSQVLRGREGVLLSSGVRRGSTKQLQQRHQHPPHTPHQPFTPRRPDQTSSGASLHAQCTDRSDNFNALRNGSTCNFDRAGLIYGGYRRNYSIICTLLFSVFNALIYKMWSLLKLNACARFTVV